MLVDVHDDFFTCEPVTEDPTTFVCRGRVARW